MKASHANSGQRLWFLFDIISRTHFNQRRWWRKGWNQKSLICQSQETHTRSYELAEWGLASNELVTQLQKGSKSWIVWVVFIAHWCPMLILNPEDILAAGLYIALSGQGRGSPGSVFSEHYNEFSSIQSSAQPSELSPIVWDAIQAVWETKWAAV